MGLSLCNLPIFFGSISPQAVTIAFAESVSDLNTSFPSRPLFQIEKPPFQFVFVNTRASKALTLTRRSVLRWSDRLVMLGWKR